MKILTVIRNMLSPLFFGLSLSNGAKAGQVIIGMADFRPYYVEEGKTGIIPDILTAAFRHLPDYQPVYRFGHTSHQLLIELKAARLDAVAANSPVTDIGEACRSNSVMFYQNVAITRKAAKHSINSFSDLEGMSIVTFENGKNILKEQLEKVPNLEPVQEMPNPESQARMLFAGCADVSLGDVFIFLDVLRENLAITSDVENFDFHFIFSKANPATVAFNDHALCARFNEALETIRSNGEYDAIYNGYMIKFGQFGDRPFSH